MTINSYFAQTTGLLCLYVRCTKNHMFNNYHNCEVQLRSVSLRISERFTANWKISCAGWYLFWWEDELLNRSARIEKNTQSDFSKRTLWCYQCMRNSACWKEYAHVPFGEIRFSIQTRYRPTKHDKYNYGDCWFEIAQNTCFIIS